MALLKNFSPAVFKNITVMRHLKELICLSLLTCCRAPAVTQVSSGESSWHSPAACEKKSHVGKPSSRRKLWPVAGHGDAGGVTLWPSSKGDRFILFSSSGFPQSPGFPQAPSHLSSRQQDPILSVLLGDLELSLTPLMGKCWNEKGKPRAFVLRNKKHPLRVPGFSYYRLSKLDCIFCFALDASLANVNFVF